MGNIMNTFTFIKGNSTRCIYEYIYTKDNQRLCFIAKVFPIYDDSLSAQYESRGSDMELLAYKTLVSNTICSVLYLNEETYEYKHTIEIQDDDVLLDFSGWGQTYIKDCNGFSVIVLRKYLTYDTIDTNMERYSTQDLEIIFVNIMKEIHRLNLKYKFVHGDLKTDNVLVNKHNDIKIIDFDGCKLGNYYSENLVSFYNSDIIDEFTPEVGFMFDFYRLYCSIYLWDDTELFVNQHNHNEVIEHLNFILQRVVLIYHKQDNYRNKIFNNMEYFVEWMMYVKHEDIVDFIYLY